MKDLYDKLLQESDFASKKEESDIKNCQLARIAGLLAFTRSQRLLELLADDTEGKILSSIVNDMVKISEFKASFSEPSYEVLCGMIDQVI
jgi:hypothetical protein